MGVFRALWIWLHVDLPQPSHVQYQQQLSSLASKIWRGSQLSFKGHSSDHLCPARVSIRPVVQASTDSQVLERSARLDDFSHLCDSQALASLWIVHSHVHAHAEEVLMHLQGSTLFNLRAEHPEGLSLCGRSSAS